MEIAKKEWIAGENRSRVRESIDIVSKLRLLFGILEIPKTHQRGEKKS